MLGGLLRTFERRNRHGGPRCNLAEFFTAGIVQRRPNPYVHGETLASVPLVHAANRCDITVVAPIRDPNVAQTYGLSKCWIEWYPSIIWQQYFRQRMRCLAANHVFLLEIRRRIAARN